MKNYLPELSKEENKERAEFIARELLENGARLVVYVRAGSGMAYQVRPELFYYEEGRVDSSQLSYWFAYNLKKSVKQEWFGDWVRFSGIGYDRAHQVAYDIGAILWELAPEITRAHLSRPLDLATRRYYQGA